ncbi:MAG: CinA family nicotinamide mononucleotide deamidase-related protein [Planctomycetaceae bacterium]|nr:CinA family nicotinamide mononucleotide deamidase-related protein [Planctomycetaceae bacterium]
MFAEIISNGDEITSGKILDTNSQWLSLKLDDLGITPLYHTVVGDDLAAMVSVLKIAASRADLVLWTGGLGPTADDLTRQAFADFAGVPLEKNEQSIQEIKEMFQRRGREMPKANEIQAYQPKGATPIPNPHGTAPGIKLKLENKLFLAYPGVPVELKEMWAESGEKTVQEFIQEVSGKKTVIRFRSIHSFGLGESQVEAKLPDIVNRKHFPRVGITANGGTITLRIAAEGITEEECFRIMEPTAKLIYEKLGDLIFGEGDDTLPDVVCRKLKKNGKTLAVIEAGTRGLLAEAVSHSEESAGGFAGGIVLPQRQEITVAEMVRRGRRLFNTDYFLLVGAYPLGEPDRNRNEETLVAVADAKKTDAEKTVIAETKQPFVGHPGIIDDLHIKRVLDLFRRNV